MNKKNILTVISYIGIFALVVLLAVGWKSTTQLREDVNMYKKEVERRVFDTTAIHNLGEDDGVVHILEANVVDINGEWATLEDSSGKKWVVEMIDGMEGELLAFICDNNTHDDYEDDYIIGIYKNLGKY